MSKAVMQPESEANRYTRRSILRSEKMYGEGFQSPGGVAAVASFCERLQMQQGMKILDIGSGLGGADFYFAHHYDAKVLGLDVAQAMVELSTERARQRNLSNVLFRKGDIRTFLLSPNEFDLAWTRDAILYIPEKLKVWKRVFDCLKPGGQLFITDFCRRQDAISGDFAAYLEDCSYYLQDIGEYSATLSEAGFQVAVSEDVTSEFIYSLEKESEQLVRHKAEFLGEFEEDDFRYLVERWEKKTRFCRQGDFRWGLFVARKP
jgi:phosphoethanolamine N-methyltransferase